MNIFTHFFQAIISAKFMSLFKRWGLTIRRIIRSGKACSIAAITRPMGLTLSGPVIPHATMVDKDRTTIATSLSTRLEE